MDNSQSSEVFSDDSSISGNRKTNKESSSYHHLINKVRKALNPYLTETVNNPLSAANFSYILNDCSTCLSLGIENVTLLLSNNPMILDSIAEYLRDAICVLQMLKSFIKTVLELNDAFHEVENFPTTVAVVIKTVFKHCRDSETLYGDNLKTFEIQLKDLFRTCHELQVTYLSEMQVLTNSSYHPNILKEALETNLEIGQLVQSLDVKTMAEQWKAYVVICEKHQDSLQHTNIIQDTVEVLCKMVKDNINSACEKNQDEKMMTRSLKVARFIIKILNKICNILKMSQKRDYTCIHDFIYGIYINERRELYNYQSASTQFMQLYTTTVIAPADCLIKELIVDVHFHNCLLGCDSGDKKIITVSIIVYVSTMKSLLYGQEFVSKAMIINSLLDILMFAPSIFYKIKGLYLHTLTHAAALSTTLNNEDYSKLERRMIECLLNGRCFDAMFASNLWVLLDSHTSRQLLFNQLIWLCTMFKKLGTNMMFKTSPQKIHLGTTIRMLFGILDSYDKMKICKQFRVNDDDNLPLWVAIGIDMLPDNMKSMAEAGVLEKLKDQYQKLSGDNSREAVDNLINLLNLSATCSFKGFSVSTIVRAWMRLCPSEPSFEIDTLWFYEYISALANVTEALLDKTRVDAVNIVKVLHIVSNLIQKGDTEVKLILTKLLCKIVAYDVDKYRNEINAESSEAFSNMLLKSEDVVKDNLICNLTEYGENLHFAEVFSKRNEIRDTWYKVQIKSIEYTLSPFPVYSNSTYVHHCIERTKNFQQIHTIMSQCSQKSNNIVEISKFDSDAFDFDVEMVCESDSEPMCEKVKLDDIGTIVSRLENDASLLNNVKENVLTSYKARIKCVRDKLSKIIN